MKEMSFLLLSMCFLGISQVHGQNYQVIFPGQEGTNAPAYNQQQVAQNPFSSQGQDSFAPGSNEVLGNYFNGNLPQTTVASQRYQPQQNHRLTPFGSPGPSQLPFTSSYLAPPASTSIPRQTHFFGNNYDFFRQFHEPGFQRAQPQQQQSQPQQQSRGNEVRNSVGTFQPQNYDPFRSVTPTTNHFFNNFGPNSGTPSQPTFTASAAPSTTAQSFTTTQFYTGKNNNPFTFSVGTNPSVAPPAFQSSRPIPPVYQPIQNAPTASTPVSPSQPRHQSSFPTITYPLTEVKSQPAPTQNSFNNYEDAAKALGITHGLRVITTETLSAYPTVSVKTEADSDVTEKIPAIIVTSKRTTDAVSRPTEEPSTYPTPTRTTTTTTPVPPTTTTTTPSPPRPSAPVEQNYYVSSTPDYYDVPTSPRQPYINNNYFPSSTTEAEDQPHTFPSSTAKAENQPYYFPSSTTEAEDQPHYFVSSTPTSVPITYTGRSVPNVRNPATTAAVIPDIPEQPRVEVVSHSRQRDPLFRHSNRVVTTNDLEIPYYVPQQQQPLEEEPEQPIIIPRPTTTEGTTTTSTTTTITTTTTTTPRPRTRPPRPVQNTGRAHVRPRQKQRAQQQEQPRPQVPQQQPQFQQTQQQPFQRTQQQQFQRTQQQQFQQPQQQLSQERPRGQGKSVVSPYYYNNLKPGLLYTNTNGAYQSYYNGEIPQQQHTGLEEIEPQVIDFNIPNKLSPVRPQNENQQDFLSSFPPFVPFPSVTEQSRFQPSPPVVINNQVSSAAPPSPSDAPGSVTKTETGEVYKVGPKGRLLRKRKRVRPNRPAEPQPPTPSFIQPEQPSPFSSLQEESPKFVPSPSFPPFRPSQSVLQTQEPVIIDRPSPSPFQPTTYRPNLNALRDNEAEDEEEDEKPTTTTFRSRKRVKVGSAVRSTTESAVESKPAAPAAAAGSDEEKTKVIASRLKSLERQIRFRNRSKSS